MLLRFYAVLGVLLAPVCAAAPSHGPDVRVVYVARYLWCGLPCDDVENLGVHRVKR